MHDLGNAFFDDYSCRVFLLKEIYENLYKHVFQTKLESIDTLYTNNWHG
jgi:hypothetical protein